MLVRQKASIVLDLCFGDSGKGTIVDYLVHKNRTSAVVRFNGGAQAAHNVRTADGRHHTFSQFGAGTFTPGVRTHLSRFVLLDPGSLLNEAEHLRRLGVPDALARLSVDRQALVVTPYHKAANRIREVLRGSGRHGSVGMGVGETKADEIAFPHRAVYAGDMRSPETLVEKLSFFRKLKFDEFQTRLSEIGKAALLEDEVRLLSDVHSPEYVAMSLWKDAMRMRIVDGDYLRALSLEGDLVFEGAQGVLIDEWHGFHPYTTWSTATPDNAKTLLSEIGFSGETETIGVVRSYFTRHGVGPFPTEDLGLSAMLPDEHNTFGRWQEGFRVGWFDAVLARYAIRASGGVDSLAVTNIDRARTIPRVRVATRYGLPSPTRAERAAIEGKSGAADTYVVENLKRKPFLTDLGYQETLTRIANRAQPYYEYPLGERALLETIERELKVPVSITSYGPTALDKRAKVALQIAA